MSEQRFTWVPFYEELARKLLEYKNNRSELIGLIREVYNESEMEINKVFRLEDQPDIDPFSLFTEFNRSIKDETRLRICKAYKEVFALHTDSPSDLQGIPVRNSLRRLFYTLPGDEKYNPECFNILWELFETALVDEINQNTDKFNALFNESLKLNCVALASLTMALFWIQPKRYVNLDAKNSIYLTDTLKIALKQEYSGIEYLELCKNVLEKSKTSLLDLSFEAHQKFENRLSPPSTNPPALPKEKILELLCNGDVFTEDCRQAIEWIYEQNCPVLLSKANRNYFDAIVELAKIAHKAVPHYVWIINPQKEADNIFNTLSVLFQYIRRNNQKPINCMWQMREELKAAYEEWLQRKEVQPHINISNSKQKYPLNTILYGPPGTGKTYHTAIYAVAIIKGLKIDEVQHMPVKDDGSIMQYDEVLALYKKYKENGQIAFTTFHQSYGYEDFIEGIRPMVTDGVEQDETNIIYKIESGVFKSFCDSVHEAKDAKTQFSDAWEAMVESIQNNADKPYIFTRKTGNTFNATLAAPDRLRVVWTGGTYNNLTEGRAYEQWLGKYDRSQLTGGNKWVYDAIQAVIDELITKFNLPIKPTEPGSQNRVFIIDEINRGNISKIFGELITLIETSKRSGEKESISVRLPYSHTDFSVPNNVYLLGTMNTADRSIALLDTALRRRFVFKEMMPKPELLDGLIIKGIEVSKMLERMNQRIEVLYDREHTIGHAYFMPLREKDDEEERFKMLAEIFRDRIIPLLQEYFYDDYEKIRLVLGDNQKPDAEQFIKCNQQTADIANLFGNTDMDFSDCRTYKLNPDSFTNIDAYKKI